MTDERCGPLDVDVDETGTFRVHGDIDIAAVPALDAFVRSRESGSPTVFDFQNVDFIDSSGLRVLLGAARRAHDRGTVVRLRNVGAAVRRMLEITGTAEQFQIEK